MSRDTPAPDALDDACPDDPEEPVVIPITGELDLHAFAPRDVAALVGDYVRACLDLGLTELRLVHGRGRGVQRARVRRVLATLPEVYDVRDAAPSSGGWGATVARLAATRARAHTSASKQHELQKK